MAEIEFKKYCPRCDRVAISGISEEDALAIISRHMDRAHPDMDNYIKEDNPL